MILMVHKKLESEESWFALVGEISYGTISKK